MKPVEIRDLVTGLLAVIFAAIALGQYGKLERFAAKELPVVLHPRATPAFFPQSRRTPTRGSKLLRSSTPQKIYSRLQRLNFDARVEVRTGLKNFASLAVQNCR